MDAPLWQRRCMQHKPTCRYAVHASYANITHHAVTGGPAQLFGGSWAVKATGHVAGASSHGRVGRSKHVLQGNSYWAKCLWCVW